MIREERDPQREILESGEIPVLMVEGKTLPEVWERSLLLLWEGGVKVKTQYDKPEDPASKDCTMTMVVYEPFAEPRIHRALPTGLEELEIYRQEVVLGIHDHLVREGGWSYSYHDRLFHYPIGNAQYLNQIEVMIEQLAASPYTRRAEAITWVPEQDSRHHEPPCLQRIWCRILQNENGEPVLNVNTNWRSRDAFKAAFMNMFALTDLQRFMAEEIGKRMGRRVLVGRYVDISDSYHLYGAYFKDFQGFLGSVKTRTFKERTFTSDFAGEFFAEARKRIAVEREKAKR